MAKKNWISVFHSESKENTTNTEQISWETSSSEDEYCVFNKKKRKRLSDVNCRISPAFALQETKLLQALCKDDGTVQSTSFAESPIVGLRRLELYRLSPELSQRSSSIFVKEPSPVIEKRRVRLKKRNKLKENQLNEKCPSPDLFDFESTQSISSESPLLNKFSSQGTVKIEPFPSQLGSQVKPTKMQIQDIPLYYEPPKRKKRFKKGGLAYRLDKALKLKKSRIKIWHHEKVNNIEATFEEQEKIIRYKLKKFWNDYGNTLLLCELVSKSITTNVTIENSCDSLLDNEGSGINFYPHPPLITQAYIDIIREWKWKTFTVLYENDESLLRLSDLIVISKEQGIVVTIEQLDREGLENYRDTLKKVWKTKQKYLVIDCNINILEDVLTQCQQVGLMTSEYSYFITNLDAHTRNMFPFQWSETNITGIRLVNPEARYVQDISRDLFTDAPNGEPIIQTASKLETETALLIDAVHMFLETFAGVEKTLSEMKEPISLQADQLDCYQPKDWAHGYNLVNLLKTASFRGLTGPIEFNSEGHRSVFGLQVYEIRAGGIINVATWNSSKGLNITRKHPTIEIFDKDSMRNKTFVIIISLTDPYGMLRETSENLVGNERYEGFSIDLIHELSLLEGFNYTFTVQADGSNGKKTNGRWTGMIGKVIDGEADMAITDLTITSERADAVDFTSPFMNLGVSILFQKPSKAPPNFFSFAEPFAIDTWIALAVAFMVVSLSFFLLGRICPDEWTNPYPCVEEPEFLINQFSLTNSVWFATGAMLQQGSEIAPIAIPTRLVSGVWWFFVLIMVSSYTANLASFLVTENNVELITDVKSLVENAEKYGIRYGAKANGSTMDFFEKSTGNQIYQDIGKHMREHPEDMHSDNKDGVTMAETIRYAFFMESTTIEYNIQRHCNLTIVGDRLDEKGYGIALKKDSPYRTKLSTAILKLQSSGVIEKIRKKWWEERKGGGQCTGADDDTEATPLDLQNVEGIFYVTIFGTILGAVLVLFEYTFSILRMAKKAKMSFREALKQELKFFIQFNSNVKPVLEGGSEDEEEKSHSKSESNRSKSKSEKSKSNKSKMTVNGEATRPYGFIISSPSLDRLTESP